MATEAQILANRHNCLNSTGPKGEEGKLRSRRNSLTHGLAGTGGDLDVDQAEFEVEKAYWLTQIKPVGSLQESMFKQLVLDSIRIERCHRTFLALCSQFGQNATINWDQDRYSQAQHMLRDIHTSPCVIATDLEATPHAVCVKLDTWERLRSSLKTHGTWTDSQRDLALDLLGIHPDLRDAETPIDPDPAAADTAEINIHALRLDLIEREIGRLQELRDGDLRKLDAMNRSVAVKSIGAEFTKPLTLLDRYERAAIRRRDAVLKELKNTPAPLPSEQCPPKPEKTVTGEKANKLAPTRALAAFNEPTPVAHNSLAATFEGMVSSIEEVEEEAAPFDEQEAQPARVARLGSGPRRHLNRRQRRALAASVRHANKVDR